VSLTTASIVLINCLKLSEDRTTRRISKLVRQLVPDCRPDGDIYVLRRQRGRPTMRWWRFAERRRSREAN